MQVELTPNEDSFMDYAQMTAPCVLDCFNCWMYKANDDPEVLEEVTQWAEQLGVKAENVLCNGCRNEKDFIPGVKALMGEAKKCGVWGCSQEKGFDFCSKCEEFPCDHLHPYADMAQNVPHNYKVFNLCLINKMGLEKWADQKSRQVRDTYFSQKFRLESDN